MSQKNPMAYEYPFRPTFEGYSAASWWAFTGAAIGGASSFHMPSVAFLTAASITASFAGLRTYQAVKHRKRLKRLSGQPLTFIDFNKLKKNLKSDRLWFGSGFPWTAEHAQFAYELSKSTMFVEDENAMGAHWLHGLNEKEANIYVPLNSLRGHMLVVGTTGAGKTRLFDLLISQDILRGEPVIVVDPKGDKELRDNMRKACIDAGQPERFIYFHPSFPEESARIDPLCNYNRPTELATRIASLLSSEGKSDPFRDFAHSALDTVIQGIILSNDKPNLVSILSVLQGGIEELVCKASLAWLNKTFDDWKVEFPNYKQNAARPEKQASDFANAYFKNFKKKESSHILENLYKMHEHNREHFGKMVASLLPILNMLVSGTMGDLLSPDLRHQDKDIINTRAIINGRMVLYIGLDSLSDGMVGSALGSLILSDLTAVAGDRYNFVDDADASMTNIYVDEAAEVINNPTIQMLNKGRGAGFRMTIATQSLADFEARLGNASLAEQVLANINNYFALRLQCQRTKEFITEKLPSVRLKYIMHTQATNTDSGGVDFSGNTGERLMEEEGELFDPTYLGKLPNLEYVCIVSAGKFMKGRLPILQFTGDLKTPANIPIEQSVLPEDEFYDTPDELGKQINA